MKNPFWLLSLILMCCTIALGTWAYNVWAGRDFDVVFSASDDEVMSWAEKAKADRWVEIVTYEEIVDNEAIYVPVPNNEIDDYLASMPDLVLVRRWLSYEEGMAHVRMLNKAGYSNADESYESWLNEMLLGRHGRKNRATLLGLAALVVAIGGIVSCFKAVRLSRTE